ncbi:MAG: hypothetical protein GC193_14550 [Cryomorphaceae bacterium]|nr:hypothetical protein [Cryomorphaceae bacterium]
MRIILLLLFGTIGLMSFSQDSKVKLQLSSGPVLPFNGSWSSAELQVEANRIRLFFGYDFARYDKLKLVSLESRKYAASINNVFGGCGYKFQMNKFQIVPSLGVFIGVGYVKEKANSLVCSNCSFQNSKVAYYARSVTSGARLTITSCYSVSNRLDLGATLVFYPVVVAHFQYVGQMAGALQLSLAYTLWRQK